MSGVNQLDDTWLQAEAEKYGVSLQKMKDLIGGAGDAATILTNLVKKL